MHKYKKNELGFLTKELTETLLIHINYCDVQGILSVYVFKA